MQRTLSQKTAGCSILSLYMRWYSCVLAWGLWCLSDVPSVRAEMGCVGAER
jgi:hypothetical protein